MLFRSKRIYRVNGVDISNAHFFRLEFHEGYWSLNIAEHNDAFSVYGNKLSELMDEDTIIQLTALDGMVKFDKKADKRQLQFPRAVSDLLTDICEICGVQMADYSVQNLFNADYEVSAYPETEDLTYRQLLIWICQITCTCAYMDWNGHLRLGWYSDTEPTVSVTAAQRFDSDLQEQSITVTGVQIQTDAQTVYTSEDENGVHEDGYVLCIQSNGLIQQEIQALANAIGNKVRGFTYTPFSAKVFPMPYDTAV